MTQTLIVRCPECSGRLSHPCPVGHPCSRKCRKCRTRWRVAVFTVFSKASQGDVDLERVQKQAPNQKTTILHSPRRSYRR